MTRHSSLDEQLNVLNALHTSTAKTLDSFADTSKAIADRARRIVADVEPWERARENIASTIEEMSRAARCYHPPPALRFVLTRKEKNPEVLCKCIDYLVFTDNYLATHTPNPYGDQILSDISTQLVTVMEFAEDIVKEAFITALEKKQLVWKLDESEKCEVSSFSATPTSLLIHNPGALRGIDRIVRRLGENFDRTSVVSVDVKELFAERMLRYVDALFDSFCKEEEMQPCPPVTSRHGVVPVRKHYQKGAHRLLGISQSARQLVSEVAACLKKYVLEPLDDSFDVVEMPGNLGTVVFDRIQEKCFEAIKLDHAALSDPTRMFVLSRGEGIGLWGKTRHFRDTIFIGLDLLEELWKWRDFSESLPGENHVFSEHVDAEMDRFLFEVRDMLDGYVSCKGALDAKRLKGYTNTLHRTEWLPSLDCRTHMSATNQVYFHKVLLTSYFGAVKLALYGSLLSPLAEEEALKEMENYMVRCVLGTLMDLETIAKVALELQVNSTSQEDVHVNSPAVFMLNNISFLIESYRTDACFHRRRLPMGESERTGNDTKKEAPSVSIAFNIITMLEDEKKRFVDDFAAFWSECFPPVTSDSDLESIGPTTGELRKSQRMAAKRWYRSVAEALTRKISACRNLVVLDPSQRNALIEASVAAVRNGFRTFESVLQGRTWSDRPLKWMLRDVEQWEYMLSKSF